MQSGFSHTLRMWDMSAFLSTLGWTLWFQHILYHFRGDKCDCMMCVRFSSKHSVITTVVLHLACKSKPSTKKAFPVLIKTPVRIDKETMSNQKITWLPCDPLCSSKLWLLFSVNRLVASGLLRLRHGDGWFREPRKWSNFSMWALVIWYTYCICEKL